jgi:hypothetical protein
MRAVPWSLAAVGLVVLGVAVRPPIQEIVDNEDSTLPDWVPPAGVYQWFALGDLAVAGDLAWVRLVQLMGSDREARRDYPTVPTAALVVSDLDPSMEPPIYYGAVLGMNNPANGTLVETLLTRGEASHPTKFDYPMLLGSLYHHVLHRYSDAQAAYERAIANNGPPFLGGALTRVATQQSSCAALASDLRKGQEGLPALSLAQRSPRALLEGCYANQLRSAVLRFRLANARDPKDPQELQSAGMIQELTAPPGECWSLLPNPHLEPCP